MRHLSPARSATWAAAFGAGLAIAACQPARVTISPDASLSSGEAPNPDAEELPLCTSAELVSSPRVRTIDSTSLVHAAARHDLAVIRTREELTAALPGRRQDALARLLGSIDFDREVLIVAIVPNVDRLSAVLLQHGGTVLVVTQAHRRCGGTLLGWPVLIEILRTPETRGRTRPFRKSPG